MDQHAFETAILRMWTTTRIPLTRANIQAFTGARRDKIEPWLDAMAHASLVEIGSDDEGEMIWTVRGSARPATGPRSVGEASTLDRLRREVGGTEDRRIAVRPASTMTGRLDRELALSGEDRKSLLASGLLSFFFGPLGWLYAAPMREAVPASLAYLVAGALLPHAMLTSLLGITAPITALLGVLYAWRFNKRGHRVPMLAAPSNDRALPPGPPRSR